METLILQFIGYDLMSKTLHGIGQNLDDLGKKGTGMGGQINAALESVAAKSTMLAMAFGTVFAVFGAAVVVAVKKFAEFDANVVRLYTHGGLAADQLGAMEKGLINVSSATGVNNVELAKAAYFVTSYGIGQHNATQALAVQTVAAKTAAMTGADLTAVTSALSVMLTQGLLPMNNLTQAAGEMNAAISQGAMTADQFSSALHTGLVPATANAHVSFTNMAAALDLLTRGGFSASTSTTTLRNELIRFSAGGPAAEKALNSIGLSHKALTEEMAKGDLIGTLELLKSHLAGLSTTQYENVIYKVFGGTRGTSGVETILRQLGDMPGLITAVSNGGKDFNEQWNRYTQTTAFQLSLFGNNLNNLVTVIGGALAPAIVSILTPLNAFLQTTIAWVQANPGFVSGIAKAILGVTGLGTVIFGILAVVSRVILLFEDPWALAIAGIVGGLFLIIQHWNGIMSAVGPFVSTVIGGFQQIGKAWSDAWSSSSTGGIGSALTSLVGDFSGLGKTIGDLMSGAFGAFIAWMKQTGVQAIRDFSSSMNDFGTNVSKAATTVSNDLSGALKGFWSWLQTAHIGEMLNALVQWFATNIPTAVRASITIFEALVGAITPVFLGFLHIGEYIYGVLQPIFSGLAGFLGSVVSGALGFLADHLHLVQLAFEVIIARVILLRTVLIASQSIIWGAIAIAQILNFVRTAGGVAGVFDLIGLKAMAAVRGGLASFTAWLWGTTGVIQTNTGATVGNTVATELNAGEKAVAGSAEAIFGEIMGTTTGAVVAETAAVDLAIGPIGWLTLALGAAVGALAFFANSADDANKKLQDQRQLATDTANSIQQYKTQMVGAYDASQIFNDYTSKVATTLDHLGTTTSTSANYLRGYTHVITTTTYSDADRAIQALNSTFSQQSQLVQVVTTALAGNKGELGDWAVALQKANGDGTTALNALAATGNRDFQSLDNAMYKSVIAAQKDANDIANAYMATIPGTVQHAVSAYNTINDAYANQPGKRAAALALMNGQDKSVIDSLTLINQATGLTFDQITNLGTNGTIAGFKLKNGMNIAGGSVQDVLLQLSTVVGGFYALPLDTQNSINTFANQIADPAAKLAYINQQLALIKAGLLNGWNLQFKVTGLDKIPLGLWRTLNGDGGPPAPISVSTGLGPTKLAAGGPVDPMRAYLVGEKGPELFVSENRGQIIPNHILTGARAGGNAGNSGGMDNEHLQDLVNLTRQQLAEMRHSQGASPAATGGNLNAQLYNVMANAATSRRRGIRGNG